MKMTFGGDPRPKPQTYTAKSFVGQQLSLHELFHANLQATGDVVISGVNFNNCLIEGPAVLLPLGSCTFDDCNFGVAVEGVKNLILYPASETHISGCIPMLNCKFDKVEFFGIAFTGQRSFLDSLQLTRVTGDS